MRSEPVRHHYIPQFILRNFQFDEKHLYYFDKQTGSVLVKEPKEIFMGRNLYRDEKNYAADPIKIEKTLAAFEGEVAAIIKERFLEEREIVLSAEENAKLKLFFAMMGFRSLRTNRRFGSDATGQTKAFYRQYQKDGDFLDMWKRNLGYVAQCRSLEEVLNCLDIDKPIKMFLSRDTEGYFGRYFAVAEANEGNSFAIGDAYPVVITGTLPNGVPVEMYDIYPISANRVLFLVCRGVEATPAGVLQLRSFLFLPPRPIAESNCIKLRVKKLCTDEVQYINKQITDIAEQGFAFKPQQTGKF